MVKENPRQYTGCWEESSISWTSTRNDPIGDRGIGHFAPQRAHQLRRGGKCKIVQLKPIYFLFESHFVAASIERPSGLITED